MALIRKEKKNSGRRRREIKLGIAGRENR